MTYAKTKKVERYESNYFEESSKRNSCIKDEENHVEKMNVILFPDILFLDTLTTTIL